MNNTMIKILFALLDSLALFACTGVAVSVFHSMLNKNLPGFRDIKKARLDTVYLMALFFIFYALHWFCQTKF